MKPQITINVISFDISPTKLQRSCGMKPQITA